MGLKSILGIEINVTDSGIGSINKAQNAIKQLLNEQLKLERQRGNSVAQLRVLKALEKDFVATITDQKRKLLEAKRAEGLLLRARQEARKEAVQRAFSEAAIARAAGETAREITILNRVLKRKTLTTREAERAEIALIKAERRQAKEIELLRVRFQRLRRELARVKKVMTGLTRGFNIFTRVLASAVLIGFTARTIGRSINRFIFEPLKAITSQVLIATDQFRRLDASLLGIVGTMRAVRGLTQDIKTAAQGLPVTAFEAISGVRGLAFTPGTAGLLQSPGPERIAGIENLLQILTGLATIDPDQGISGARFAVREALAGEFRSLRFRFELSPNVIAATIGKSLSDLKADPQLTILALRTFVDTFIGPEAIEAFNRLLSVRGEKLRGAIQEFLALVGESGISDRVSTVLGNITQAIEGGVRDPSSGTTKAANIISLTLDSLLDGVLLVIQELGRRVSGITIDISNDLKSLDFGQLALVLASVIDGLARLALLVFDIIPSLGELLGHIGKFAGISFLPLSVEGTQQEIASRRDELTNVLIARERVFAERERQRRALRSQPGRGMDNDGFLVQLQRSRNEERGIRDDIVDLRAREAILQGLDDVNKRIKDIAEGVVDPALTAIENIRAGAIEVIKPLGLVDTQLQQTLRSLPSLQVGASGLGENISLLAETVTKLNDPTKPGSLGFFARRADAELLKQQEGLRSAIGGVGQTFGQAFVRGDPQQGALVNDIGLIAARVKAIVDIQMSRKAVDLATSNTIKEGLIATIQASEGFTRQLPTLFRIRQTQDVLSFLGAKTPAAVSDILGSEQAKERGANVPSAFLAQLRALQEGANISPEQLLNPALMASVARSITNMGGAVETWTGDAEKGALVTAQLADEFVGLFKGLLEGDIDADLRERVNIAIETFEDLKVKVQDVTSDMEEQFRDAAESISQVFGDNITEGIISAFEDGSDGVLAVMENMFRSIQKIILRLVVEFAVLRAFINPLLNNAFSLTGTNQLAILGATGMNLSGGQVRPFASGGFIASTPQVFPMQGGQVGLIGEEAPEAVLPLEQDESGRLGVVAAGGGGGRTVIVNMTVKTPDVGGFLRSKRQVMRGVRELL